MNSRLKYGLLFVVFSLLTFFSTKLWNLAPTEGPANMALVVLTLALGLTAFITFVKIFKPKTSFIQVISDFFMGI